VAADLERSAGVRPACVVAEGEVAVDTYVALDVERCDVAGVGDVADDMDRITIAPEAVALEVAARVGGIA
jgi:hypothetical protein